MRCAVHAFSTCAENMGHQALRSERPYWRVLLLPLPLPTALPLQRLLPAPLPLHMRTSTHPAHTQCTCIPDPACIPWLSRIHRTCPQPTYVQRSAPTSIPRALSTPYPWHIQCTSISRLPTPTRTFNSTCHIRPTSQPSHMPSGSRPPDRHPASLPYPFYIHHHMCIPHPSHGLGVGL